MYLKSHLNATIDFQNRNQISYEQNVDEKEILRNF